MQLLLKDKRIFYAEDDVKNRAGLQIVLYRAGADVKIGRSDNLENMMMMLRMSLPLNLIILDLMYGKGMTGYDIFNAIQEDDSLTGIPVIAFSAADPSAEIPRVKAAGMQGFIAKPMNVQEFPLQILSVIDGHEIWYEGILS
jgi:CheY-like chemotaxis protein